jgi:hypothetical protein
MKILGISEVFMNLQEFLGISGKIKIFRKIKNSRNLRTSRNFVGIFSIFFGIFRNF